MQIRMNQKLLGAFPQKLLHVLNRKIKHCSEFTMVIYKQDK